MRLFFVFRLSVFAVLPLSAAESKPNLVFVLIDDMGWEDTSLPFTKEKTAFNNFYRTPSMERLAAQGVKLTSAYSCAVCTPSRVSWMTGRNTSRHGVTNWTFKGETSGKTNELLPPKWKMDGLQPGDAPTAPGLLHEAGYRTILVGKAHFGAYDTPGADPKNLGFDINIAGHGAGHPASYQGKADYGGKDLRAVPGLEAYKGTDTHLTDALTSEACKEIDRAVADKTPFFLYLSHYAVHLPIQPHRPYDAHYESADVAKVEKNYASMVEGMDASLGKVMDELQKLGVAENTLVVFWTDNGGLSAHGRGKNVLGTGDDTHNKPLREGKGSAYEGGIRVPAIVGWAKVSDQNPFPITPGTATDSPAIIEDLFPTLVGLAGAKLPESPVDGRSLLPLLKGGTREDAPLVWHYPNLWTKMPNQQTTGYRPHSVIRSGGWKAIHFYDTRTWELYHVAEDLGEAEELSAKEPERLLKLAKELQDLLEKRGAVWPIDAKTGAPRKLLLPS